MLYIGGREVKQVWAAGRPAVQAWAGGTPVWGGDEPAPETEGLQFVPEAGGTAKIQLQKHGSTTPDVSLLVKEGSGAWQEMQYDTTYSSGDRLYVKAGPGGVQAFGAGDNNYNHFYSPSDSSKFRLSGDMRWLFEETPQASAITADNMFNSLFKSNGKLASYADMNWGVQLVSGSFSLRQMFAGCTSLTAVNEYGLSVLGMASYMAEQMHQNCNGLSTLQTRMPWIYGSSANSNTRPGPGYGSSKLTDVSVWSHFGDGRPCDDWCGQYSVPGWGTIVGFSMFTGCASLSSVTTDLTAWPHDGGVVTGMDNWLQGTASAGTFTCPSRLGSDTTIQRGASYCPENWTVVNPTQTRYLGGGSSFDIISGDATRADFEAILQADGKTSADIYGVDFGQDVTAIAPSCFADWGALREVKIGDNVQTVGENAFRHQAISSVQWGSASALTAIGPFSFAGVQRCGRQDLPDGLQTIGANAFSFGSVLSVVTVPQSVTHIGGNAFGNNSNLLSVVFHGKAMADVQAMTNYPWGASGKIFVD